MAKKKEEKKKGKKELIEALRKDKQALQQVRFRFSAEAQKKTSERQKLRRSIARTASALNTLSQENGSGGVEN